MKLADFQELIWNFYEENGRSSLPWRTPSDNPFVAQGYEGQRATEHKAVLNPYAIYISEMMLQQTQATRVIPKFKGWIKAFPTFAAVAEAETKEILSHWQGLGYNRRALYVKEACGIVIDEHSGELPQVEEKLLELPGIGPYTAGALQAFVHELPAVFVETNIRTVFIHHFFSDDKEVADNKIKEKVEETLPEKNIREWYWALMDYGSHLKSEVGNLNQQSKSYQKQSTFAGSNRQLRSKLTRFIMEHEPTTLEEIEGNFSELVTEHERMKSVASNLETLEQEGFVSNEDGRYKTSD